MVCPPARSASDDRGMIQVQPHLGGLQCFPRRDGAELREAIHKCRLFVVEIARRLKPLHLGRIGKAQ